MKKILLFLAMGSALIADLNVLIFSASSRLDSYNQKLATEAAKIVQELGGRVTTIHLKDYSMPFYNADLERKGMPKNARKFRDLMAASDAIVIASPEYNASIPGELKNVIDWASREEGVASRSAFKDKKFALMSASPGRLGGARGLAHLRLILEDIGGKVLPKQVAVPNASQVFAEKDLSSLQQRLREELEQLFAD